MTEITREHINRLIEIESIVRYDELPPSGQVPFLVNNRQSSILLSAPHGAKTYRNSKKEVWHEEDEYTAGIAQLLGELCDVSVIATIFKNEKYDPNFTDNIEIAYKKEIASLIMEKDTEVKFVIDLHGAALNSPTLSPQQTIDLGFRSEEDKERSITNEHIEQLEVCLQNTGETCTPDCFVVGRNRFSASSPGTITSFVFNNFGLQKEHKVQSVQIEVKPQVRIAHRFPTAMLYKSCGQYAADPNCVMHLLQSLVEFIEYLKEEKQ
jgi:hypothetical protein